MRSLRAFSLAHRHLAALLLAAALAMKALVPAGYMVEGGPRVLTVSICADSIGERVVHQVVIPAKGGGEAERQAKGECAFSSLNAAALGGADLALLALALAFILALGFAPVTRPRPGGALRLRPPLRGPPAAA